MTVSATLAGSTKSLTVANVAAWPGDDSSSGSGGIFDMVVNTTIPRGELVVVCVSYRNTSNNLDTMFGPPFGSGPNGVTDSAGNSYSLRARGTQGNFLTFSAVFSTRLANNLPAGGNIRVNYSGVQATQQNQTGTALWLQGPTQFDAWGNTAIGTNTQIVGNLTMSQPQGIGVAVISTGQTVTNNLSSTSAGWSQIRVKPTVGSSALQHYVWVYPWPYAPTAANAVGSGMQITPSSFLGAFAVVNASFV